MPLGVRVHSACPGRMPSVAGAELEGTRMSTRTSVLGDVATSTWESPALLGNCSGLWHTQAPEPLGQGILDSPMPLCLTGQFRRFLDTGHPGAVPQVLSWGPSRARPGSLARSVLLSSQAPIGSWSCSLDPSWKGPPAIKGSPPPFSPRAQGGALAPPGGHETPEQAPGPGGFKVQLGRELGELWGRVGSGDGLCTCVSHPLLMPSWCHV